MLSIIDIIDWLPREQMQHRRDQQTPKGSCDNGDQTPFDQLSSSTLVTWLCKAHAIEKPANDQHQKINMWT